jgi:glycosyltransferase 2 family protein
MKSVALRALRSSWLRFALVVLALGVAAAAVWWRGPDWEAVWDAFDFVSWRWVVLAVLINLASIVARSISWRLTIGQALPEPHPRYGQVFSAFCVGLLGNAVLPARAGELARVAVLRRHMPEHGPGTSATLVGTVFAHRLFDLPAVALLVVYVLLTAKIPEWAVTSLVIFGLIGVALVAVAMLSARHRDHRLPSLEDAGTVTRLVGMARQGLAVLRAPLPAAAAIFFQLVGWILQLLAVWTVMKAFDLGAPLPAAGLVLLLMNIAIVFPLWPGNVGLLQAAVALPLRHYGVAYPTGFAFALVLQAVEMSVGVGIGLLFLAREGVSFAMLRRFPAEEEGSESAAPPRAFAGGVEREAEREGAPVPR